MTDLEKYKACFVKAFELKGDAGVESLEYEAVPEWDSVGHMTLIANLEDDFGIEMRTDDIVDFSSFETGKKILANYGIQLQ
jgi:acyl carrier protein